MQPGAAFLQLGTLALLVAGAGCYQPAPPGGAYSCQAGGACPDGQRCVCDQCVRTDGEAACGFTLGVTVPACVDWPAGDPRDKPATCVHEHEAFALDVQALQADGNTPATGFQGALSLSSSWGDATPVRGAPIAWSGGAARLMVTLNRETIYSGGARVTVRAGTARATTRYVAVVPPHWTLDPAQVTVPSPWADVGVTDPAVVRDGEGGYRMYFAGLGRAPALGKPPVQGLGVATSSDGLTWVAAGAAPLLASPRPDDSTRWLLSPAPLRTSTGGWRILYRAADDASPADVLGLLSRDGLTAAMAPKAPVLKHGGCSYCGGLSWPGVTPAPDGVERDFDLFFLSIRSLAAGAGDQTSVGHAVSSDDGASWDVDPVPVLSDTPTGTAERVIFAPRVLVDGTVYKMFYATNSSFTAFAGLDPCAPTTSLAIAYATSSDGADWVRSPSTPVINAAVPWAPASRVMVPGSVLLTDEGDPARGYTLHYSTFQRVALGPGPTQSCVELGVGRATRP